jgi:predicted DCC family thiol-disulfide oxidoreductase YuxK
MQVLALIAVHSLHGRVTLLENGGDWMLGELALWTAFLPLGRRFSVDAVRASLRARRETTAAELADRRAMDVRISMAVVVSLAVLALALQIANSYIFNAIHKGGPTWRSGTAVHYVLHQDRMCTWLAVWMRPHMGLWLSRILSWGSLVTESILPVMLLAPVQKVSARRVAIVCIVGLHLGFQCFINLGIFSFAMIGYAPFLMTGADWEALARFAQRRKRKLTAYFDAGCGVCFQIVRVWARLDRLERITFRSSADLKEGEPHGVSADLLARTLVVVDDVTGKKYMRADAVAQVLRAFPVGWLWSLPLRLPGLRALANLGYDLFAGRRETISSWLGLAACGVPAASSIVAADAAADASRTKARPPFREQWSWLVWAAREVTVLTFVVTMISETLFINAAIPKFLKHEQPLFIKRLVAYPRFIQAWSMFASDAPMTDQSMVIDAVTVDGRHVDPYSEATSRYPNPGRNEIPTRLDNDSFVFNYSGRIPNSGAYHQALIEWVLNYHERTGNPRDRIVSFDAYEVTDDSPPIGELNPRNIRSRLFLSHPPKH